MIPTMPTKGGQLVVKEGQPAALSVAADGALRIPLGPRAITAAAARTATEPATARVASTHSGRS